MTYHPHIDYACKECKLPFIPFRKKTPCPKCSEVAGETFPLLDEVMRALTAHGFKQPLAYLVGRVGDRYVMQATLAVELMDTIGDNPENTPENIATFISAVLPPSEKFFAEHLEDFLTEILKKVKEER